MKVMVVFTANYKISYDQAEGSQVTRDQLATGTH